MPRIKLQAAFLWAEALLLAVLAASQGLPWLFPLAGALALLAALASGRLAWFGLLAALSASGAWFFLSNRTQAWSVLPVVFPVVALIAGTLCAFLGILASLHKDKTSPLQGMLGRFAVALHFLTAGILFAASYLPAAVQLVLGWGFCGLVTILAADTFVKLVSRLYTPRRHWETLLPPGAFFFFRWMGKEGRACFPAPRTDEDAFSLKLPEMWMWPALRRQLLPLLLSALLLSWLGTCFHEVGAAQSGVRQTAGAWDETSLDPGFHLSLPWPLGTVHRVDTGKLHETVLGFRSDPGQPILWERAHYEGEEMSLVGGGDDLLSISVPIHYRIADAAAYLRGAADPERLVRDIGNRILLDLTVRRGAAEVMTTAREDIRRDFQQQLQEALDHDRAGIRIEEICLRDVHPPVQVAPSYQEVLAAMEEREAFIHDGESYRRDFSTRARGESYQIVVDAESAASSRLDRAKGETTRFTLRRDAWAASRPLFELREGFRVFDDTLANTKKAIFDDRIRSSMSTQLDLRKVLNPDLVDTAPVAPETLVPRPSKSRDAFDLDIEGFLRTDRGQIPAPVSMPDDNDYLFKPEASPQKK
ncbi:protease modulator HflK [Luteolibacter soli]|uniref:Protease modulator HflK n=1 Tax=Luteolibacter soli TaxID=3135280 RepID=A0ABU9AXX6_9BACT